MSGDSALEDRASIWCLRHQGVRLGEPDRVEARAGPGAPGVLEDLVDRLHRELHHADAEGDRHPPI
jgi:hypothetical protein